MYMYRCHDSQTTELPADVITAQRAVDANDVIAHCTDVSKVRISRKHVLQNDANSAEFLNQGIYTVFNRRITTPVLLTSDITILRKTRNGIKQSESKKNYATIYIRS